MQGPYCSNCGVGVAEGDNFCRSCGAKIAIGPLQIEDGEEESDGHRAGGSRALWWAMVPLAGLVAAYMYFNQSEVTSRSLPEVQSDERTNDAVAPTSDVSLDIPPPAIGLEQGNLAQIETTQDTGPTDAEVGEWIYQNRNELNVSEFYERSVSVQLVQVTDRGRQSNGYYPISVRVSGTYLSRSPYSPPDYDLIIYLYFQKDPLGGWIAQQYPAGSFPYGYN